MVVLVTKGVAMWRDRVREVTVGVSSRMMLVMRMLIREVSLHLAVC